MEKSSSFWRNGTTSGRIKEYGFGGMKQFGRQRWEQILMKNQWKITCIFVNSHYEVQTNFGAGRGMLNLEIHFEFDKNTFSNFYFL